VGNDAGRKSKSLLLSGLVDGSKKAAPRQPASTSLLVDRYLAHFRQIDHQSAVASAEARKTMPAAAHSSENTDSRGCSNRSLYISDTGATRDQAGRARYHAVPDAPGLFVFHVLRTHQISSKLTLQ
jgi:hypothetical protein